MKSYPIYWSKRQVEEMETFLNERKAHIIERNQGTTIEAVLGTDCLQKLQRINPKITYVSLNYHSCAGKAGNMIIATIGVGNIWTDKNKINGQIVRGWKIIVSEYITGGYLNHYILI